MLRAFVNICAWTIIVTVAIVASLILCVLQVPDIGPTVYIYTLGYAGLLESLGLPTLEGYPDQSWPVMTTLGSTMVLVTLGIIALSIVLGARLLLRTLARRRHEIT